MKAFSIACAALLACNLLATLNAGNARAAENESAQATTQRDGQHDFDFSFGTWRTHLKRLADPLSGSTTWAEYDGTTVVHKIWNGKAHVVELDAEGPAGRIEALALRLYNPESRQWSMHYANSRTGSLSVPAVGEFKDGRGEFYNQESINGRAILVRNVWSHISANSARFEQAFSTDGGKTWEMNWIAVDTRVPEAAAD